MCRFPNNFIILSYKYPLERDTHASLLISKLGAQPLVVAERLGHEKIQTTLNTYSHLYPNQARDLAEQLNELNEDDFAKEDSENARET